MTHRQRLKNRVLALARYAAVALFSCQVTASEGFDAKFKLQAFGATVGHARWTLVAEDGAPLTLRSESQTAGLAALVRNVSEDERSTLERADGAWRPTRYRYERKGDKRARVEEIAFDWDNAQAKGSGKHGAWEVALEPGTVDGLSYILAMIADLQAGKTSLRYQVLDNGTLKSIEMEVLAGTRIDTALGELDTIPVKHQRENGRVTTFWCASALGFMPVRMHHLERDGWSVELAIESLVGQPPPDLRF